MAAKSSPLITVYRGFPETGCYIWSPFVTKLETRLRFANIRYRTEQGSIPKAPRGKVPYVSIEDGEQPPQTLSDSTLITKALIEKGYTGDLNQHLSPTERLHDLALKALLEDKLPPYQIYERWILNFYTMRSKILAALPWPVQVVVGNIIYRKVTRNLQGQGTMAFTEEEISAFRQEIWASLNAVVAEAQTKQSDRDGPFWVWGGEGPTEVDAVLFGFIVSGLVCDAAPASKEIIKGYPALVDYARRIHDKYFPDYELWE
ncbi:hypothetical protein CNMCM8980_003988 [Aspergillus fumigatiaffinis]|uniref:Thioredoxin-like fold domain-containing protein n=1 Tax=Aspergillus fumigatiaffinis TaxID=340414 RepID=A0A8H4H8N5_9EURO|nr:hypothetical protein CNMCM5878_006595 [Aspergillus fumigatiaffinis]KAF4239138.1 hypothetical protein CNMCM6457_009182 [Aspergillus fumigatiaffinis]KAF4245077.1 hypothetical protein CNMCM6805_006510 [Aspergillus fumigatiaffinis]KAF4249343.1 hypothetical protein CNMCM8980_003988 [Aspergillus fumigatiaffinis]